VLPHGTPEARLGLAVGMIVGGIALTVGGFTGEVLGGAATVTGIGAAVGVPAMLVSTTLVVGGAGNIAAGIRGLTQSMMPKGSGTSGRTKHRHRVRRALQLRVQIELRQLKLNVGRQLDLWQRRWLHLGAGHAR
jgi:hypothetical protein